MSLQVNSILSDAGIVHLGDELGEMYDTTFLLTFFGTAYRDTIQKLRLRGSKLVVRRALTRLPKTVSTVVRLGTPALPDLGTSVIAVSVRMEETFVGISSVAVTGGIPTYTTAAAHGRLVGDTVQVTGVEGLTGANVSTIVTAVPAANQLTMESVVVGSALGSGSPGISFSTSGWNQVTEVSHTSAPGEGQYMFENGVYRFSTSTLDRQVMFEFWLTPSTRTFAGTDYVEEDRARDVLALKVALLAGEKKLNPEFITRLERNHSDALSYLLGELTKDQQKELLKRPSARRGLRRSAII